MAGKVAAVVLAAGRSTRFNSKRSKLLHTLCGKPMLDWVLDAAAEQQPAQIVVVYGENSAALLETYGGKWRGIPVAWALQDPPLGTGHALEQAFPALSDDITHLLVLPGDAPLIRASELAGLVELLEHGGFDHVMCTALTPQPDGLGRVVRAPERPEAVGQVVERNEKGYAHLDTQEINTGIYLFSRKILDDLQRANEAFGMDEGKGEYYLPRVCGVAPTLAHCIAGLDFPVGVDDRSALAEAEAVLLRRIRKAWMERGATFRLPETTYIEHDVELARDVEVGPHNVLLNSTRIGEGTVLVQGCLLDNCAVGANCELRQVRGLDAVVGDNVQAGPYVNLRPGTVLHDNVKVGNFVETKNADVGAGSKLPHLQYIGDATMGEGCNIGAGTIFCNYDGFSKLHTTLGNGVFVGSNSSLQGGIEIGDEGYVAMASAITRDIPAGALGIGRARQENKDGYVEKLKDRLKKRKDRQPEQNAGGSDEHHR